MDFRVFSRNISENMHARCVREDTKQALKGNLQADGVQSRQTLFVRYCPKCGAAEKIRPSPKSHGGQKEGWNSLGELQMAQTCSRRSTGLSDDSGGTSCDGAFAAKTDTVQTTAASAEKAVSDTGGDLTYEEQETYSDYYDQYAEQPRPATEITVSGADFQKADCESYEAGSYTDKNGESRNNA